MSRSIAFPDDFLWGCATAAYQIEGSPLADGAGPSIWQRFCHDPRLMAAKGDTGDIACDHYNRMESDVGLMKQLGLQAYRFSVGWGRVLPEGTGRVNEAGLGFYERLVDTLLDNGIEPMLTLFHWDMPAALDDRGGWLNRDSAEWFADYARVMFERLDGRVKKWVTLNEPWVVSDGGYLHGVLAPGHRNMFEAPIASHNMMRAHGAAVKAYREIGAHEIGLVVNIEPKYPATESAADKAATARADAYMNRQYLDPAIHGSYPAELKDVFGEAWPQWPEEDMALIRQKLDFVGINYYTRNVVTADESWPLRAGPVKQTQATYTETGWEVFPQGLTDTLVWFRQRYGDIPLYVTENGAAFYDSPVAENGEVEDPQRIAYLKKHIAALSDAIAKGVDLRGYMLWSLFDNLEWSLGYAKRFGIIHVNFETLERTPKKSAVLYADVIASNGAVLAG
ncbi:GH1 family beta-glucosidase [Sphingomonas sp. LaA6.9]|uniref:GH1 family beta-glucosidase n=1 Tax=Sphingomonas sp. LaA6.9 TaxID=2919914 RepID=UPI001F503F68|nr:GH1 family beta-glucosidase [Sphingomonas sp. LaA6.9]MCJ8156432.1 GH1 family beta-glucosidase [Sphingomonas sp. LaA6.9]